MAEASDFLFGMLLGFVKSHHKIPPLRIKWAWPWARGAHQNLGLFFNISVTAKASDFKIGKQPAFAKVRHKVTSGRKSGRGPGLGELPKISGFRLIYLQWLYLATSNLACP